jgi:enediyne biosynthesis protein E4
MRQLLVSLIILLILIAKLDAQESRIRAIPHAESACSEGFIAHELAHITTVNQMPLQYFDGNGSGLAIGELNNDGKLDIVLANLDGEEQILWNEGHLNFRYQVLDVPSRSRGVIIADMDGDGWNDILFSSGRSAPSLWKNLGNEFFDFRPLQGINHPAFTMNLADLDADNDLDMVAASYDAEMESVDAGYLLNGGAGAYYYENRGEMFFATRLVNRSQALAIYFMDVNGDERRDVLLGNDFSEPDRAWLFEGGEWIEARPFPSTSYNTMGFDAADIDNNGTLELYATDWLPYFDDTETQTAWQPMIQSLRARPRRQGDVQRLGNSLQVLTQHGYHNFAEDWGVEATGWAWSAKFGDLDSDGFLDLYVVNGMIDNHLLAHLPNNELRERNLIFQNQHGQFFVSNDTWGLDALAGGRGMSMADLDSDGDLDIVVNNLLEPAMLYENQLCGGDNLTIELNPQAIGATLYLETSSGIYRRDIAAMTGYLSGDSQIVHFGLPIGTDIFGLEILWPDGTTSYHDQLSVNQHWIIQN